MIWYLNGTFPTKQPRGLLIQGWHYLVFWHEPHDRVIIELQLVMGGSLLGIAGNIRDWDRWPVVENSRVNKLELSDKLHDLFCLFQHLETSTFWSNCHRIYWSIVTKGSSPLPARPGADSDSETSECEISDFLQDNASAGRWNASNVVFTQW
jgi:hypothetical protein